VARVQAVTAAARRSSRGRGCKIFYRGLLPLFSVAVFVAAAAFTVAASCTNRAAAALLPQYSSRPGSDPRAALTCLGLGLEMVALKALATSLLGPPS
jgi:hypothetical protein